MNNPTQITAPDGLPFVDISREIDFSPAEVFEAYRDPEMVKRWLGPRGYEMEIERWEFESQGGFRFIHIDPEGGRWAFRGTFHTVRPDFAVQTFEFEGVPDVVSIETLTFEPLDGGTRTRLRIHSTYPAVEARDGIVASGMEKGVSEGYERLEQLLAGRES